jgi:hypothetical protein
VAFLPPSVCFHTRMWRTQEQEWSNFKVTCIANGFDLPPLVWAPPRPTWCPKLPMIRATLVRVAPYTATHNLLVSLLLGRKRKQASKRVRLGPGTRGWDPRLLPPVLLRGPLPRVGSPYSVIFYCNAPLIRL